MRPLPICQDTWTRNAYANYFGSAPPWRRTAVDADPNGRLTPTLDFVYRKPSAGLARGVSAPVVNEGLNDATGSPRR